MGDAVLSVVLPDCELPLCLASTAFVVAPSADDAIASSACTVSQLAEASRLNPVGSLLSLWVPALPRAALVEIAVVAAATGQITSVNPNPNLVGGPHEVECCFNDTEAWCRSAATSVGEISMAREAAYNSLAQC